MSTNLTVSYTLTADDYHEYLLTHQTVAKTFHPPKPKQARWTSSLVWALVLFVAIAGYAVYSVLTETHSPSPSSPPPPPSPSPTPLGWLNGWWPWFLIFLVVWAYFLFRLRYPSKKATQRFYEAEPDAGQPRTAVVTDEGVTTSSPVSSTTNHWAAFRHFAESEHLFLLYLTYNAAVFIPKRAFASPEDLNAFRTLAQAKIATRMGAFPVLMPPPGGSSDQS